MALSPAPQAWPTETASRRDSTSELLQVQFAGGSAAGAGFQLLDQRLDLAAMTLDVGIEVRTAGHHHADALDLDVGDARALGALADLPLDGDRLAVGLVELAVDHRGAVGPGGDAAE